MRWFRARRHVTPNYGCAPCLREGIVPLLQMHDCLDCSVSTREQAELVAQLGCDAVSLEVPMRVDLKFGRSWGDASHTWEELTGDSAPIKPAEPAPKTATVIPIEPAIAAAPKPAIVTPPRPAIVIPLPPRAQPAGRRIRRSPPPPEPRDETEIDLADLLMRAPVRTMSRSRAIA